MYGVASFTFAFKSRKIAEAIYGAIDVEVGEGPVDRTKAMLRLEKDRIILDIEARDSSSMRAGVNTYSRWIDMAKSLVEV